MKKKLLFCIMVLTVATAWAGRIIEQQPEGQLRHYNRSGYYYSTLFGQTDRLRQVNQGTDMVFAPDGRTVYIRDILSALKVNTWVKGTLDADGQTLTIPLPQTLYEWAGESYTLDLSLIHVTLNDKQLPDTCVADTQSTSVSFRIHGDTLSLDETSATHVLGAVYSDDKSILKRGMDFGTRFVLTADTIVTPPATLQTADYTFVSGLQDGDDWTSVVLKATMGFDGSDVYLSGCCREAPSAWVRGTRDEQGNLTFPSGQLLGYDKNGAIYWCGQQLGEITIGETSGFGADVTFTYDGSDTYTSQEFIVINARKDSMLYYSYYSSGATLSRQGNVLVTAPEVLELADYKLRYKTSPSAATRTASTDVRIGVDGTDVYMQGIWSGLPDAWVKGRMADGSIVVPAGQFLGAYYDYPTVFFVPFDKNGKTLSELVLTVDAASGVAENADDAISISVIKGGVIEFDNYYAPRLERMTVAPAVPANPKFKSYSAKKGYAVVSIPLKDTKGNDLAASHLSYQFFSDIERVVEPVYFNAEIYEIGAGMTQIPYRHESYNIYETDGGNKVVYFLQGNASRFNRIGVQSIYTVGQQTNVSEVVWQHIKDYTPLGIGHVADTDRREGASGHPEAVYTLSGQRIRQPRLPGVYIAGGQKVVVR